MKIFVILLAIFVAESSGDLEANTWCSGPYLRNVTDNCVQQYRPTSQELTDGTNFELYATTRLKCFRACIFHGCKSFTSDLRFEANLPQSMGFWTTRRNPSLRPLVEKAARYCMNTIPVGYTICDLSENFVQCVKANSPAGISFHGNT